MGQTAGVILTMTCVLFVTTLLRGFQSRAASSGHKTAAGIGGTLMSACEIIVMINVGAAVVHMENPYQALWASFGAGAGWITGMILYARLVRKRREKLKALKKTKRHQQIERISREAMLELMEERGDVMQLQKAVPNIIPVFDLDSCITGRGAVTQPYVYVAAKETPVARFAAKTLLEKALREVDEHGAFPPLNWPGFEWQRGPTMVQRDRLFENGYSLLHLRPGFGPVVHWGAVGDSRVFLMDLVCIGTIVKTWIHYFKQEAQPRFASICMQYPADAANHIWRNEIKELSWRVQLAAKSARLLYGKDPLFIHDDDGDFTTMVWRSPGYTYKLKFDHSNFDIRIQVGPDLWFAFNNCFGPDMLYHLATDFTEV